MPATSGQRFLVDTNDLARTRIAAAPDADRPLPEGGVRLAVDLFALTSNNISYAAFGQAMKYWDFFPAGEPGWGCIPAWGFADVVESRHPAIAVGERVYGYLPMATHLVVEPQQVDANGFVDATAHRRELPPVYNQLLRCATDPLYHPDNEGAQAVLRPLFITSFLIDDFLAEQQGFGAGRVLLSSASSKTAIATAFCLAHRRGTATALEAVGLTSGRHADFVRSLGLYEQVASYEELESLDPAVPTVYVDFSGDAALRRRIHAHWNDRLAYSCSVGGTHWQALGSGGGLPGPRPTLFFAPAQVRKRMAPPPEGWGPEGFQLRVAQSWAAFARRATDAQDPWLRLRQEKGPEAVTRRYLALLQGQADPREGSVLSL